jgi:hypothetical protein
MKIEAVAATMDPCTMNPYVMQPYAMPNPITNSPIHSMQSMYGSMQPQQMPQHHPMTQQGMPQPVSYMLPPGTAQNVAVVDFKAGLMTQHHIAQMQQQYQNTLNAPVPTMGLIGPDGRYIPATAATAASSGMTGPSCERAYPYNDSLSTYNPNTATALRQMDFDRARQRSSVSGAMDAERMRSARIASRVAIQDRADSTNSRMQDMIDQSVRASTAAAAAASMTNTRVMKDMIDQSVRASTAAAAAAAAAAAPCMTNSQAMTDLIDERVRVSNAAAPSMTNSRAMKDLIDERVRRGINSMPTPQPVIVQSMIPNHTTPTAAAVAAPSMTNSRAMKDLIDERVRRGINSMPTPQPVHIQSVLQSPMQTAAATFPTTASGFHAKPMHEQRQIVGDAVRSVMKDYNVTPKDTYGVASSMQSRVPNIASSLSDRSRMSNTASAFTDRARYERHDSF